MAATFTWSILQCDRVLSNGGITAAHWACSAEETVGSGDSAVTHTANTYGDQGLTPYKLKSMQTRHPLQVLAYLGKKGVKNGKVKK